MVEAATDEPLFRAAAFVARTFCLDPIAVLMEKDRMKWALRIAAHNLIMKAESEAAKAK
jgi:hypothetical protein